MPARLAAAAAPALLALVAPSVAQATLAGASRDASVLDNGHGGKNAKRAERTRRVRVSPYLEVNQTAIINLQGADGDVLTYTAVAAGVNARIETRRVAIAADLRYEHQFAWGARQPDQDILSGLANARVNLVRDALAIEGGVLGVRVRTDGFNGANSSLAGAAFVSKAYSAYVGPDLNTNIGDLSVIGAYRLGYSRVDAVLPATPFNISPAGSFDESWLHNAALSVGMQPGAWLPVGWSVSGGYIRETSSQLSQHFSDKFGRVDLIAPIARTVALVGGIGYESIRISNRDALRDSNGLPVRDGNGRLITDPASPRLLAYDNDEIIWDAGVLWKPSRRTSLEARYGHRYGSRSVTGSFDWRPGPRSAVKLTLFDSIESFGRALNGSLANLPADFVISRNPFSGDIGGCAFGAESGGSCFADTLSGVTAANYRNRGVYAQFGQLHGRWTFNAALGYARRTFITDGNSILSAANGVTNESYFSSLVQLMLLTAILASTRAFM